MSLVRLAALSDIGALLEVERSAAQAFLASPHAWVADDGVTDAEAYPPLIAGRSVWVADDGGAPAGFLTAVRAGRALHILELAVRFDAQRQGLGRALMGAAIEAARTRGCEAVTLTTFTDVAWNAPFYRTLGFETVDRPSRRLAAILAKEARHGLVNRCAMRLGLDILK